MLHEIEGIAAGEQLVLYESEEAKTRPAVSPALIHCRCVQEKW